MQVAAGVVDFGQGSKTVLCQIAAETLDIPYSEFLMESVDTAIDPFGGTSSSSRITMQGGKAVYNAAVKAREELLRLGGILLEADPEDLELRGGVVRSRSHEETRVTLAEIAKAYVADELKQIGAADSIPPPARTDKETGQGEPYEIYGFGSQVAEVLVDEETGEVEVTGVWAAHDVGRAISPMGVEQQIEGGVYMGIGFCMMEEVVQREGRMLNPDMHGYLAPDGGGRAGPGGLPHRGGFLLERPLRGEGRRRAGDRAHRRRHRQCDLRRHGRAVPRPAPDAGQGRDGAPQSEVVIPRSKAASPLMGLLTPPRSGGGAMVV